MAEASKAHIFLGAVINDAVTGEFAAYAGVNHRLVSHEVRGAVHVRYDKRTQVLGVDVCNVEAADIAITLHKGDNRFLGRRLAGSAVLGLASYIGFVGFHNRVRATQRALRGVFHRFADAMAHEPSSLVGDTQHALDLLCTHSLLGSAEQVIAKQPLVKRNL